MRGDGIELAVWEQAGDNSPLLCLLHATGMCKEVWLPLVDELRQLGVEAPVVAWDQAAHGDSERRDHAFDWWDLGRDAAAIVGERPAVGVGHSSGAAALVMAELLRPGTFQSLVLIEPIVFPPPYGPGDDLPLVAAARRRRHSFPTRDLARLNFASKPPFDSWNERVLDAYVDHGLADRGGRLVLKCDPEDEAEYYRTGGLHRAWDRLGELSVPVLIVAGEASDTHPAELVEAMAASIPRAEIAVIPDAGHFVPMERPGAVVELVSQFLAGPA